ncbi:hypothetical protein SK128_012878 [Halocaridina rubra]|uniref:Molybdenum cofactor sulfurase n=1 Tax=Halocaridina rubra TaxID=373956 RepID=A0AAN9A7I9_HALRR
MADVLEKLKVQANYDVHRILQEDFQRCKGHCYLDHAAATLYSDSQIRNVMAELQDTLLGNPHSHHTPSDTSTQIIESVRQRILEHFHTSAQDYDVIFTAGTTDALKIVAHNFIWNVPSCELADADPELNDRQLLSVHGSFVYLQDNHTSVLGIRESACNSGASVYSVARAELNEMFSSLSNPTASVDVDKVAKTDDKNSITQNGLKMNCLFAYSAQCNFSGVKAPSEWIEKVKNGALSQLLECDPLNRKHEHIQEESKRDIIDKQWYVLLDASSYVSTCPLDLSELKADFVPISFYKIFGYPTGLGCLLVSHRASEALHRVYHGGGTILMADSRDMVMVPRPVLHEEFEDGTLPYLDVIALRHGFDVLKKLTGGMENIQQHVYHLARYVHHCLRSYRHANGKPVAELYSQSGEWNVNTHGSIVNFNLLDSDGSYIGYSRVEKASTLCNIHLRTGCFCNPGACQMYLNISKDRLRQQFEAGHICGDDYDLVDGFPTGSVRISFGYMSTYEDADKLLNIIVSCFVKHPLNIDTTWMLKSAESVIEKEENMPKSTAQSSSLQNNLLSNFVNGGADVNVHSGVIDNINYVGSSPVVSVHVPPAKIEPLILHTDPCTRCSESSELKLTDIILYPVKSCGRLSVKNWQLAADGLQYDRRWMVVSDSGVTQTQKRIPRMSLIKPSIDIENNTLTLSFEGKDSVSIPLEVPEPQNIDEDIYMCGGRVCGDRVKGMDCGSEVGDWLSEVLDYPDLKLMRQINIRKRKRGFKNAHDEADTLSLANHSQYLVLHRPSIRSLMEDIRENGSDDLDEEDLIKRFRGNIILDGGKPYDEEFWSSLTINGIVFEIQEGCRRCEMICINPDTSKKYKEPMLTLAIVRGSSMMFGVHAKASIVGNTSRICLEDPVVMKTL